MIASQTAAGSSIAGLDDNMQIHTALKKFDNV
jgi:hypothetical protein